MTQQPMGRFQHGGDVYTNAGLVDFSASLHPLGMPASAVEALRENVAAFQAYPDPACRQLAAALARHDAVPESRIVCCAGATDAFERIVRVVAPKRIALVEPCFSGYEEALHGASVDVCGYRLAEEQGFCVGSGFADFVRSCAPDLVFLCTPNNPTGRCVPFRTIGAVLDACNAVGALLVLDECFQALAGRAGHADLVAAEPNLVVVNALTKTYAMAGLRVGWATCGTDQMAEALRAAGSPWAVSVPAQLASVAALADSVYVDESDLYIRRERDVLQQGLAALGLNVVPSDANFILFQGPLGLYDRMLGRGFIIRRCENFPGLDATWYRIAVRSTDENRRFLEALEKEVRP